MCMHVYRMIMLWTCYHWASMAAIHKKGCQPCRLLNFVSCRVVTLSYFLIFCTLAHVFLCRCKMDLFTCAVIINTQHCGIIAVEALGILEPTFSILALPTCVFYNRQWPQHGAYQAYRTPKVKKLTADDILFKFESINLLICLCHTGKWPKWWFS